MKRTYRSLTLCTAALLLLAAGPLAAQSNIQQGIDTFQTIPFGGTFVNVNLPAGFFCDGSAPVAATVNMQGVPLATNPAGVLGGADTVVERLKDAFVPAGGCAEVPVVVRALSLTSSETIAACGGEWVVDACTCGCCGVQPITRIRICDDGTGCGCGQFDGELKIDVCLKFRNVDTGVVLGPVQQRINLSVSTPYCDKNPGSVFEAKDALTVDTNCDSQPDLAVPCTTNFFPGATCGGPSCPPDVCHEGPDHPHCVNPVCDRKN